LPSALTNALMSCQLFQLHPSHLFGSSVCQNNSFSQSWPLQGRIGPHLWLLLRIYPLTLRKDRNIVFVFLNKNVICHSNDLHGLDFEAGFFECFALGTSEHVFALIKMPARKGPLSYCRAASKQVEMNSLLNKQLHSFKGDKSQRMILENVHVPVPKRPIRCPATIRPSSSLMMAMTATRGWSPLHAISLGPGPSHVIAVQFPAFFYGFSRQRMLQL
jgi:hypothetical protein